MRKLLILAALPLALSACTSSRCRNPDICATCPICNRQASAPSAPAGSIPAPAMAAAPTTIYRIAPAKLVSVIQQAITAAPLNLKVLSVDNGVIQTDWKDYEGEFHIARRWQDRTRYRITVIPDVNDPTSASRFEVAEESQRRSNDRANWEPASPHPERAQAVVQAINARLPR